MNDKVALEWVTRCRHCGKAIGLLDHQEVGWLHFSTHDGHQAEPMRPFIDHGIAIAV